MFLRGVGNVGASVYGVDVNEAIISSQHDPRLQVMSGTALQFPDSSFDTVYSFELIEHIPEIKAYFSEVSRVLKNHGKLIVSFP